MILALKYLYENSIVHGRICPQHFLIDQKGYLVLTGFKYAIDLQQPNENYIIDDIVTPYTAPELLLRWKPTYASDYYSLGLILQEFIKGKFMIQEEINITNDLISQILVNNNQDQVQVMKSDLPEGWSLESADFINKLLQKNPLNRLGYCGIDEVLQHPWLKNELWPKLQKKHILSPLIGCQFKSVLKQFKGQGQGISMQVENKYDRLRFQMLFEEYYYFKNPTNNT